MSPLDLLAAAQPFAFDLLERTASTPRVQAVVQQSLAPAFLLGAIGAIMNVIMSRMIWIAGRIERIEEMGEEAHTERCRRELQWLSRRRRSAQRAISFATAAAVNISLVIGFGFLAAYIEAKIGSLIAFLWVLTMVLLVTGLVHFLHETRLAAMGFGKGD
ncbi:MAG: DUF2721 domain-containing protein [Erythrobacter sp.]|uniref:DUF2721 domain-containing protein n=1 Tax=Erythrobacter sp. TaxID=1042 RepID=UPI0032EBE287